MNNKHEKNGQPDDTRHQADQSRRDFLKKSKYAVYATPLMTGLIISSNAAHASCTDPIDCGDVESLGFND